MTTNINCCIEELVECLTEQNELVAELIEIGENQLEALKVDNIQELNDITAKQEKHGRNLALKEKKRRELVQTVANFIDKRDIKMSDVINIASKDYSDKLQALSESLIKNQLVLRQIHETSRMLLKQSLQYVQKMMDCIEPNRQKTYGSSGQIEQTESFNALNRSV